MNRPLKLIGLDLKVESRGLPGINRQGCRIAICRRNREVPGCGREGNGLGRTTGIIGELNAAGGAADRLGYKGNVQDTTGIDGQAQTAITGL